MASIYSAGLNPVDWKIAGYIVPLVNSYPNIYIVTAVAKNVSVPKIGDRVFFQENIGAPRTSTFQQFAAIPNALAISLPNNVSFEQGATLGVAGITAAVGLFKVLGLATPWAPDVLEKNKGTAVLIWGGSTSVGHVGELFVVLSHVHD
ncbi:hypothetical protein HDU98_005282 [Podochytrium sp. JEL0797]|nr:hypothetical protein HDU98_005282 [Podochytrium sp. JEL0797]